MRYDIYIYIYMSLGFKRLTALKCANYSMMCRGSVMDAVTMAVMAKTSSH